MKHEYLALLSSHPQRASMHTLVKQAGKERKEVILWWKKTDPSSAFFWTAFIWNSNSNIGLKKINKHIHILCIRMMVKPHAMKKYLQVTLKQRQLIHPGQEEFMVSKLLLRTPQLSKKGKMLQLLTWTSTTMPPQTSRRIEAHGQSCQLLLEVRNNNASDRREDDQYVRSNRYTLQ